MPPDAIELEQLGHSFVVARARLEVLERLDLRVEAGQVISIVGPNGCGKSTLLRLIAGLIDPGHGRVSVGERPVTEARDDVALVFQEPRLLPWRTVSENVAFPLELAGIAKKARDERSTGALGLTGLDGFDDAFPGQLSGGMAQRAALARALVTEPAVLLLDEPFSALDALTRERLDVELLALWESTRPTIVLVTHSISEAVFLADRVLVMSPRPGRIVADIAVRAPRPRRLADVETPILAAAAAQVRSALSAGMEAAAS